MVQDLDAACDPALTAMSKVRLGEVPLLFLQEGPRWSLPALAHGSLRFFMASSISGEEARRPPDQCISYPRPVASPLRTRQGAGAFGKSKAEVSV